MIKSELRKEYIEKRKYLTSDDVSLYSQRIADRFFALVSPTSLTILHIFIPIAKFNEIDTSLVFMRIWEDFPVVRTVAPRIPSGGVELEHTVFSAQGELVQNSWGIWEPANDMLIDPSEIDIVLVPLLCFDESGYRVGYGKGYYDRFLAKCRLDCRKIGLSYFPPVKCIEGVSEFDVKLDVCITPDDIFNFGK